MVTLVTTVKVIVSINQRCPSVHCRGSILVRRLVVWTKGLVLTEVLAQLGYLDSAPIHAVKVEGECKPWSLPAI